MITGDSDASKKFYRTVIKTIASDIKNHCREFPVKVSSLYGKFAAMFVCLSFYEIQDLPLFLRRFWALKRECSELHDR